jgi:CubicO group peptidase (beta-lactamase class C family)
VDYRYESTMPEPSIPAPVDGFCEPRFEPVREALEGNLRERAELGAAVSVVLDGRPVVDIWGGWMDLAGTRPWQRDTLVDVFSAGKPMAAVCVLMLFERGAVDLDAPVARYWPEFAAHGKGAISVRTLLSHRAGLPGIRRALPAGAMYDWELMTETLAGEEPWWEPGTRHGYHVNTFGFLAGEVVRRAVGESVGTFFRKEIAEPLEADFHFGVGAEEDPRIAEFTFGDVASPTETDVPREALQVYMNPPGVSGVGETVNTRAWRAAVMPSTNGHATARALAAVYSALIGGAQGTGRTLLRRATLDDAIAEASAGPDAVLGRSSRFGLGFQLTQPERPLGPNPRAFGHFGAGGSLGFADPDTGLAFGYVMNSSGPRWQNPRNRALIDAVFSSLG